MTHALDIVFGDSPELITWWQMTFRAVLIFAYGIVVFRFSYKRFFGQSTDFDIVIAVLIGSTMSRALTANARLLPTLVATTTLIVLHGLLARMAWRWKSVGWVAKGVETRLVERGCMDRRAMRRCAITEQDLLEAVRAKGTEDLSRVEVAVLERNGKISIILRETE